MLVSRTGLNWSNVLSPIQTGWPIDGWAYNQVGS